MSESRYKNVVWAIGSKSNDVVFVHDAQLAVLMDIRDELQEANRRLAALDTLARCYRIPRALDAMYELGVEARRRKRLAAKRRKSTRKHK